MHRNDYQFEAWNMISANSEMLTPTEAAIVASVEVRDVNRVIDESILPKATANPPRGRPREPSSPPAGAAIVSTRRAPRRKRSHEAAR